MPYPTRSLPAPSLSSPFIRKLEGFVTFSQADQDVLLRIGASAHDVPARTDLIREGEAPGGLIMMTQGIACRLTQRASGVRQITGYLLPGDTCDPDLSLVARIDHTITTLSSCKVAQVSADAADIILQNHPMIARAMRIATLIDVAILREWLVNIGCRTALERIAHLFCELMVRLGRVGLATGDSCDLPMTQQELANTTGMTTVHVNRSLQELRRRGLIELKGKNLRILDWPALKSLAEFKPGYLRLGETSPV